MELLQSWLQLLHKLLPSAHRSFLILNPGTAEAISYRWPVAGTDDTDLVQAATLSSSSGKAMTTAGAGFSETPPLETGDTTVLAHPIALADGRKGGIAVEMHLHPSKRVESLEWLRWSAAWLQMLPLSSPGAPDTAVIQKILSAATACPTPDIAASVAATMIAEMLECAQISICRSVRSVMRVVGVSGCTDVDQKSEAVAALASVATEMTGRELPYSISADVTPDGAENLKAASDYVRKTNRTLFAVPLGTGMPAAGVILCERAADVGFTPATQHTLEILGYALQPLVSAGTKNWKFSPKSQTEDSEGWQNRFRWAFGNWKFAGGLAVILLAAILTGVSGTHRIIEPAKVEGRVQRAVVAPYSGYVKEAFYRAGDVVQAGAVMAELDTRELQLDQQRLRDRQTEVEKQQRKALASLQRPEIKIHRAQIDQTIARLDMVTAQLARAQMTAPIDGMIIQGDLSQSLGAPIERGDVLFEIAPVNDFRLAIQVRESEIAAIKPGQQGKVLLTALPNTEIPFIVHAVSPIYEIENRQVSYRVEATLRADGADLLPGMQGEAEIVIGQRRLAWIYLHSLADYLRLWVWRWMP